MAIRQLETAIALYYEGSDFYSVITLAGAADTVLGQALKRRGQQSELHRIRAAVQEVSAYMGHQMYGKQVIERANLARNALKHWDDDQPPDIAFDAPREAADILNRVVINYWSLFGELRPPMQRFVEDRSENDGTDDCS